MKKTSSGFFLLTLRSVMPFPWYLQVLKGHTDFVNSVTFAPGDDGQLASTGDDLTCRVWSRETEECMMFNLTAPGMAVCWHPDEPLKVGEETVTWMARPATSACPLDSDKGRYNQAESNICSLSVSHGLTAERNTTRCPSPIFKALRSSTT